jgi:hypothetical protein
VIGYLGEFTVSLKDSPFYGYTDKDFALYFIDHYGGIDGEHHKNWVLDQVARILNGTKVHVSKAMWENGYCEYRLMLGDA